jgi:hypothetical protein
MKQTKLSLKELQGKLSRSEMRQIMAGVGGGGGNNCNCNSADDCSGSSSHRCNSCGGKAGDKYQGACAALITARIRQSAKFWYTFTI